MSKFGIKMSRSYIDGIIKGFGQILDFRGSYSLALRKKYLEKPAGALDHQSIKTDWETVGNDIRKIMRQF